MQKELKMEFTVFTAALSCVCFTVYVEKGRNLALCGMWSWLHCCLLLFR